ncbi:hypothetical protein RFI_15737 [Reticulomyxa filosa]|uniref:Uncharacterized protein n=1 Tax=Reticulomyxa filosa TaxID=46433 RepID=X6N6C5_RETFI|nr:hypothetical protein RFI_15737 [Reticulomyxa filosa]|eukprot:ETO21468.1 hypothetical protein RFI_15737 [Reticulomyxa filosa]
MYLCFVYLFSAILWTGLAGGDSRLAVYDFPMFIVFVIVYVLLQLAFLGGALISRQIERTKLTKTDEELHEVIRHKTFFGLCCVRQGQKSPISVLWNREALLESESADDEKTLVGKGILVNETISRFGFF